MVVLTSQPFITLPSQFSNPGVQRVSHTLEAQIGVPFGRSTQTFRHAPQLFTSVLRTASQPFIALPSQSARPGGQVMVVL